VDLRLYTATPHSSRETRKETISSLPRQDVKNA